MEIGNLCKKIAFALMLTATTYSQNVTVNLSSEHQVIKGFGGINHPNWYGDLSTAERELAFGNGNGQLGLTVLRTYVSDNKNQWLDGIQTAKRAAALGVTIFATPWNPPAYMTYNDATGQKRINTSNFSDYADHLNSYVTTMKNNGVDLYSISVQNEPDYAHEWTEWTPQEGANFIKNYASQIKCRLMTPESFQYLKKVYTPILNDAEVLKNVAIFGAHLYGTPYDSLPYPLFEQKGAGKELWMTEVYTDSKSDANIWDDNILDNNRHALKVAEHIHYALVKGNFQTYVYWPIRRYYALIHDGAADEIGTPNPAKAGTVTKRGWCMAQFSKFVRPGFIRVDATSEPIKNVFVSAYKNGNDVVIVAVNKNKGTNTINISVPNTKATSWEQYTTSASKSLVKGTDINGSSSFKVTLDASSVTTFVGKADAQSPMVKLTLDTLFAAPATITLSSDFSDPNEGDSVVHIAYYNGDKLIVDKWLYPFVYNWEGVTEGTYTISAIAYDLNGNSTTDVVTIKVNPAQEAYKPNTIPGTIQFENYDIGGNGLAYFDDSKGSETLVDFRTTEDVDIETCTDADGGYNVGYSTAGEWLEYTATVETTGVYDITLRVACNGDGRTASLTSDGDVLASDVVIPNTGGWQAWQYVKVEGVSLEAGTHVLRVTVGAESYVNLNYMTFTLTATSISGALKSEMKGLSVYPNPLKDKGLINIPQVKDAEIIVYASNGEIKATLIPKEGETTISWDETGITESGVYTVVLNANGKEYARVGAYVVEPKDIRP